MLGLKNWIMQKKLALINKPKGRLFWILISLNVSSGNVVLIIIVYFSNTIFIVSFMQSLNGAFYFTVNPKADIWATTTEVFVCHSCHSWVSLWIPAWPQLQYDVCKCSCHVHNSLRVTSCCARWQQTTHSNLHIQSPSSHSTEPCPTECNDPWP